MVQSVERRSELANFPVRRIAARKNNILINIIIGSTLFVKSAVETVSVSADAT